MQCGWGCELVCFRLSDKGLMLVGFYHANLPSASEPSAVLLLPGLRESSHKGDRCA